jgi:glutamate N-acetyltransferase/amino-acid N-acetyltransferase
MTTVQGFTFSATSSGIKGNDRSDLALIYSIKECVTAALFTTNKIKAAPVVIDKRKIVSRKGQAVVVNSGNANACTGTRGYCDAEEMINLTAHALDIDSKLVYGASTGVIGEPLPMGKIRACIPDLVKKLSPYSCDDAARAIMTTDTFHKIASETVSSDGKTGTIAGIAKGAGMIHPDMATMLCFLFTDISIKHSALNSALKKAVDTTFNRLSVDGDMSTNDTILIMANGLCGNSEINLNSLSYTYFCDALKNVTYRLARAIARDGEGATKVVEVRVTGAETEADAVKAARAIANSYLVKTAVYGEDANWGRIIAVVGYCGVDVEEEKIDISINNVNIVHKGISTNSDKKAHNAMASKDIIIHVDLALGSCEATIITCDLTEEYIKINAHYRT